MIGLKVDISEDYKLLNWYSLEEIEYVIRQPITEALGLPIYYEIDSWQDVTEAEIFIGRIYLSGHFKIQNIHRKLFEVVDIYDRVTRTYREIHVECILKSDGYSRFYLPPEVQDQLFTADTVEELNSESSNVTFKKSIKCDDFGDTNMAPVNYMHSLTFWKKPLQSHHDAISDYCEKFGISNYKERLELLEISRKDKNKSCEPPTDEVARVLSDEKSKARESDENSDRLSTQGRNALIRTARALAKCIIHDLSDTPTSKEIEQLLNKMEEEHNDIPCSAKTLRVHLQNPD